MTPEIPGDHKKPLPDWHALTFSLTETDYMYRSLGDTEGDPVWD